MSRTARPVAGPPRRTARWTGSLAACVFGLAGCAYDDTPMAMKVIDGETGRLLYARMLAEASPASASGFSESEREMLEFAYAKSQEAYGEVLRCLDDGPCRLSSLHAVCDEAADLLAVRRRLAPHLEMLAIAESLSSDRGPLNADRLRLLRAKAMQDGRLSELEEQVLTLATAASLAHGVWALTPEGEKERLRRRSTHAIDEFAQRCEADRL